MGTYCISHAFTGEGTLIKGVKPFPVQDYNFFALLTGWGGDTIMEAPLQVVPDDQVVCDCDFNNPPADPYGIPFREPKERYGPPTCLEMCTWEIDILELTMEHNKWVSIDQLLQFNWDVEVYDVRNGIRGPFSELEPDIKPRMQSLADKGVKLIIFHYE